MAIFIGDCYIFNTVLIVSVLIRLLILCELIKNIQECEDEAVLSILKPNNNSSWYKNILILSQHRNQWTKQVYSTMRSYTSKSKQYNNIQILPQIVKIKAIHSPHSILMKSRNFNKMSGIFINVLNKSYKLISNMPLFVMMSLRL